MSEVVSQFIDELAKSLSSQTFVKLTLSNYKGPEEHLQKILVRPVETKKGPRLSFQFRYDNRSVVKNFDHSEGPERARTLLDIGFRSGHLFTTAADFQLTIGKKSSRVISGRPTFTKTPDPSHDRRKSYLIDPAAFYLKSLGITTDGGQIRATQQDKWRQINKYVEVLRDLYESSSLRDKSRLKITDMGSGKGYLTFAAYDYFANVRGHDIEMTGVEMRGELVDLCNQIAGAGGLDGLRFVTGTISDLAIDDTDILIALHACDTATDDALYKGIAAGAAIIVAAPCCHKEVRRQIKPPGLLRNILKHGSLIEREAETITDGLRAMLLERSGYATKVFEFVPSEHTPKNNMIAAIKTGATSVRSVDLVDLQDQIDAVKSFYGIEKQRLENLLA